MSKLDEWRFAAKLTLEAVKIAGASKDVKYHFEIMLKLLDLVEKQQEVIEKKDDFLYQLSNPIDPYIPELINKRAREALSLTVDIEKELNSK